MDRIGRYKIVRELGRGAMGVVYHAIDPNIGRPVAIKTIQLSGVRTPEEQERLRERLFREARSAGILSHPGIVTIYDVEQQGELAYRDGIRGRADARPVAFRGAGDTA